MSVKKKSEWVRVNDTILAADRRRLTLAKVRAGENGRTVSPDYIPTGENDVFAFFVSVGLGQVAHTVAVREASASDIDDVTNYWFCLVDSTVDAATCAMDAGELPEFGGASIMGGLHATLRANYDDIEPVTMLRLVTVFASMCIGEFRGLGFEVIEDRDRFWLIRSIQAA